MARSYSILLCLLVGLGCAGTERWKTVRQPNALDAAALLASDRLAPTRDERPDEVPNVPVRTRLRPCCAFGSALRVRVGSLSIPGLEIGNIRSPNAIGRHRYDKREDLPAVPFGGEHNGLVYTCRGGFIDTAHVRDYADWTLFLATRIGRQLETGGTIELPATEGGIRRFHLRPLDPDLVSALGRRNVTASLAVWMGFQLSLWHEIATWYGWASFDIFPERASAFSPEDLYSNLLGAKIAGPIITSGNALSESSFNEAVDAWFARSLEFLGAVPADLGEQAMAAVDQQWWDSGARLPDAHLVLRRNIQHGRRIEPWIVPTTAIEPGRAERFAKQCNESMEPHALRHPNRLPGLDYDDALTFEIELDERLRAEPAFEGNSGFVRHTQFPAILERIRLEARREFGARADSPEFEH